MPRGNSAASIRSGARRSNAPWPGAPIDDREALHLLTLPDEQTPALLAVAGHVRTRRKGRTVTYSPKVFLPITNLCLDRCSYCTFRHDPDEPAAWTMLPEDVRACCHAGRARGCIEALMCLGDKPERAYRSYRQTLAVLGHDSTVDYVAACCAIALDEGLLPHTNAGLLSRDEMQRLKPLNVSLGLMLETVEPAPAPARRRASSSARQGPGAAPGDDARTPASCRSRSPPASCSASARPCAERVASLRAIGELHAAYGHIQEIIVQNFRAKPTTRMAAAPEPTSLDTARTIAVARLMLPDMNIQAPPNLSPYDHRLFLAAGINDWGGISPLTLDYVNPEAPWPQVTALAPHLRRRGLHAWAAAADLRRVPRPTGLSRPGAARRASPRAPQQKERIMWDDLRERRAGHAVRSTSCCARRRRATAASLERALAKEELSVDEAAHLLQVDGADFAALVHAADAVRAADVGDEVTYVVNRNINWTNICFVGCQFCAFAVHRKDPDAYNHSIDDVLVKVQDAIDRGASEVCMQGGINPESDAFFYRDLLIAIKARFPGLHVHAFSPMEIMYGARRTGMTYRDYLAMLRDAGLGTIPGTAAEILDDDVREILSHKKVDVRTWVDIITTAHALGIRSSSTVMYGHIETPAHIARHLELLARSAEAHRRLHRVRAAALHPHATRALPERAWSTRRRSARSTSASTPCRA